jgi:phosphatidylserine/phosphatidylglycerophosphate/cardiolipin synthase-like enzyme
MAEKDLAVTFLRDVEHGGAKAQPARTATLLADFVAKATASLDVAIYDFKLGAKLAQPVVTAFKAAADRGVKVRIGYDANKPPGQTVVAFATVGGDPAPIGTEEWLRREFAETTIELKPIISPGKQLMHSKYVVRDVASAKAAVLMGSANFTDGAWTRQENNILRFTSSALAKAYETDFEEMWQSATITSTGRGTGQTTIDKIGVTWAFSPGEGASIDGHLASAISSAKKRIRVSSMVITSHAILGALDDAITAGIDVAGVYDGAEMRVTEKAWEKSGTKSAAVLATWAKVKKRLSAKPSASFSPTGPHDFMHNKVLVSDDLVLTGSYNFSKNAEGNAENQLALASAAIAKQYAAYVDKLVKEYPAKRS